MSSQLDSEDWSLRHRIEAWNLIYEVALYFQRRTKTDQFSLSPFMTTSFLHLSRFYLARQFFDSSSSRFSGRDLFTMTLSAVWVTVKAESIKHCQIEELIKGFVSVASGFSRDRKEILGPSSSELDANKVATLGSNYLDYQRFLGHVRKAELDFLNGINWEFVREYPFGPMNEWLRPMRDREDLARFRKMRSVAVHNLVLLIVGLDGRLPPFEVLAGAALSNAFGKVPMVKYTAEQWADKIGARFDRAAAAEYMEMIPGLEAAIGTSPGAGVSPVVSQDPSAGSL
jgi:hypothetical protein